MKKIVFLLTLIFTITIVGPVGLTNAKTTNPNAPVILELPVNSDSNGIGYKKGPEETFGPSSFAVDGNVIYILDPNKKLIYVCQNNQINEKIDISFINYANDIRIINNNIWILDNETNMITVLDKRGNIVSKRSINSDVVERPYFLDSNNNNVVLHDFSGNNYSYDNNININKTLNVKNKIDKVSDKSGKVSFNGRKTDIIIPFNEIYGSINVLHEDNNSSYVEVEEILDAPKIIVENTIRKFNKDGSLEGIARIPVESYYVFPNRLADVTSNGDVYTMVLGKDNIKVIKLTLEKNFNSKLPELKQKFNDSQSMTPKIMITPNASDPGSGSGGYTRTDLENRALAIINYSWTLNATNKESLTGVTVPVYLQNVSLPHTSTGIPYCWGGYDSLDTTSGGSWSNYAGAISYGANAGNINTSAYYVGGTAGLDCSGFASAVYVYYAKQSTGYFAGSSNWKTIGTAQLQNMDILVDSGSHMVFFHTNNGTSVTTYESTVAGNVEKCKVYSRTWTTLSSYVPRTWFF